VDGNLDVWSTIYALYMAPKTVVWDFASLETNTSFV